MKNNMNHHVETKTMTNETITSTADFLTPLLEVLNEQYPADPDDEYGIPPFGQVWALEQNPDEISLGLPDAIAGNATAARAIATLLWRSGSSALRAEGRFPEPDPYRSPLRFALLKRAFWLDGHWQWDRYLVIDYVDEPLDQAAARRQIDLLVEFLRDPSNLVTLDTDDFGIF